MRNALTGGATRHLCPPPKSTRTCRHCMSRSAARLTQLRETILAILPEAEQRTHEAPPASPSMLTTTSRTSWWTSMVRLSDLLGRPVVLELGRIRRLTDYGQMRIDSRRSRQRCCVSSRMSETAIRYCAVSMLSSDRYESVIIEAHGLLTTVAMTRTAQRAMGGGRLA
jgi:hypothetical protein